ncbi:MAG: transcriptional regulator [Saprospiraceae bacterium]|nr:MAG: transcriptional regulator [Saprospiraceae bacterium]
MINSTTTYSNQLDKTEARWFAVYTKYKREKQVHLRLEEKGIENYLPLQQVTRHYTRKVVQVELPLISCYLFVKITKSEYVPVLEVPDVVKFVRFSRNLIAIPEREIDLIRRVVGEEMEIEVEPSSFQIGDLVEIIGGNLTGLQGKLLQQAGKNNILLELNSLGYQMRMHVDPKLLRKIGGKRMA